MKVYRMVSMSISLIVRMDLLYLVKKNMRMNYLILGNTYKLMIMICCSHKRSFRYLERSPTNSFSKTVICSNTQRSWIWSIPEVGRKKIIEAPLPVLGKEDKGKWIILEFYDSEWVGHTGIWVIFSKIKQMYWWPTIQRHSWICGYM